MARESIKIGSDAGSSRCGRDRRAHRIEVRGNAGSSGSGLASVKRLQVTQREGRCQSTSQNSCRKGDLHGVCIEVVRSLTAITIEIVLFRWGSNTNERNGFLIPDDVLDVSCKNQTVGDGVYLVYPLMTSQASEAGLRETKPRNRSRLFMIPVTGEIRYVLWTYSAVLE